MSPVIYDPGAQNSDTREQLRERFKKVILSRGYTGSAVEGILEEWFEKYMEDVPEFKKMLLAYEQGRENELEKEHDT